MSKQDHIIQEGHVVKANGNATFDVQLENGIIIFCNISGKIRQHNIKVQVGDKVKVEMSPYDLQKGRISHRYKPTK